IQNIILLYLAPIIEWYKGFQTGQTGQAKNHAEGVQRNDSQNRQTGGEHLRVFNMLAIYFIFGRWMNNDVFISDGIDLSGTNKESSTRKSGATSALFSWSLAVALTMAYLVLKGAKQNKDALEDFDSHEISGIYTRIRVWGIYVFMVFLFGGAHFQYPEALFIIAMFKPLVWVLLTLSIMILSGRALIKRLEEKKVRSFDMIDIVTGDIKSLLFDLARAVAYLTDFWEGSRRYIYQMLYPVLSLNPMVSAYRQIIVIVRERLPEFSPDKYERNWVFPLHTERNVLRGPAMVFTQLKNGFNRDRGDNVPASKGLKVTLSPLTVVKNISGVRIEEEKPFGSAFMVSGDQVEFMTKTSEPAQLAELPETILSGIPEPVQIKSQPYPKGANKTVAHVIQGSDGRSILWIEVITLAPSDVIEIYHRVSQEKELLIPVGPHDVTVRITNSKNVRLRPLDSIFFHKDFNYSFSSSAKYRIRNPSRIPVNILRVVLFSLNPGMLKAYITRLLTSLRNLSSDLLMAMGPIRGPGGMLPNVSEKQSLRPIENRGGVNRQTFLTRTKPVNHSIGRFILLLFGLRGRDPRHAFSHPDQTAIYPGSSNL
ncbi:MAG: hypothetical protein KC713_10265, partial [Candidatus Omnitrophica bacterium]|nr:hypothetical protein [Candidatus Omnitrophota bacterium]